jgi:uncharacterized RDD family membrane protein YckC
MMSVARTWRRVVAFFVDQLIIGLFYAPVWIQVASSWVQGQSLEIDWRLLLMCFLLQFLYRWIFLVFMGATLGMLIFGIRVVDFEDGEFPDWLPSFIRVLTDHLSFFFGQAFHVLAIFRFDRRHLSDWLAKTQVRQFAPRENPPKPYVVLGTICFVYCFFSGFYSAYRLIQSTEWDQQTLIFHPAGEIPQPSDVDYD